MYKFRKAEFEDCTCITTWLCVVRKHMHTWGMTRVKWGQLSWNLSTAMVLKNTILELHLHRFYLPHDSFVLSVPEINIWLTLCVFAYHLLPHRKLWIVILLGKLEVRTLIDVKEFSNTLLQKERKMVPPPCLEDVN